MLKIIILLSTSLFFNNYSYSQDGCQKDDLGRIYCAPPGGMAVTSLNGVVCAPGKCIVDNLGYIKCSYQTNGSVIRDDLGRIVCVGLCISPSKEYCQFMKAGN